MEQKQDGKEREEEETFLKSKWHSVIVAQKNNIISLL